MRHELKRLSMILIASIWCLALLSGLSRASATTFNIEIDYMLGGSPNHSHRPTDAELAAVVQMFATQGHTLNAILSDQIPHYDNLISDPDPNPNTNQGFFKIGRAHV